MKLLIAFFRLIRWPNLFFIVLTQFLFYYCVIDSGWRNNFILMEDRYLCVLTISSVLIAAAGYIINDYFDLNIDAINKPKRQIVDVMINRRWAMVMHIVLSLAGVALGFWIDFHYHSWWIGLSNLACVMLLFGYSVTLKKKLLIGNVVISALTAWVILVVYFVQCEAADPARHADVYGNFLPSHWPDYTFKLIRIAFLYAGFAFIISLIREVIKDLEDIEGDRRFGCKTMPIAWGIPATKVFVGVWIIVMVLIVAAVQYYVLRFGWWWSATYSFFLVITPLLVILHFLRKAKISNDYRKLSSAVKLVMLAGILSMIFFKVNS